VPAVPAGEIALPPNAMTVRSLTLAPSSLPHRRRRTVGRLTVRRGEAECRWRKSPNRHRPRGQTLPRDRCDFVLGTTVVVLTCRGVDARRPVARGGL
jgi:hypothetical protein